MGIFLGIMTAAGTIWGLTQLNTQLQLSASWIGLLNEKIAQWNMLKDYVRDMLDLLKQFNFGDAIQKVADAFTNVATAIGKLVDAFRKGNWAAILDILYPWIPHSPAPLARGLDQVNAKLDQFTARLPDLTASVSGQTRALAPAYAGATYNTSIAVNANINNSQDVHQLAYVIAREFNQRMNR